MSKILLINSNTWSPRYRPTGLEYVAEHLRINGYEVDIVDLPQEDDPDGVIVVRIQENAYAAIGISIFNTQWDTGVDRVDCFLPEIRKMVADIKRKTDAPVILGGVGYSITPEDILEYVGADFGVADCGVPAAKILLEKIENGEVEPGAVVRHEPEEYLNMDCRRDVVESGRYWNHCADRAVSVSTKYGCIGRCLPCPVAGVQMKVRDPARVIGEMESLIDQGAEIFAFNYMNIPVEYAEGLCERIKRLKIRWTASIYGLREFLPEKLADSMKRSGMVEAWSGGELSGSNKIIKACRKRGSTKDVAYVTRLFKERDIRVSWFIKFGHPEESRETIDETFELIDRAGPDEAAIATRLRMYRNTELAAIAEEKGIISPADRLLEPAYYPFSPDLRDYVIEKAGKRKNCRVYY
jgi:radical SAM superfamily enzyme YgiQ (UPF0313 family)